MNQSLLEQVLQIPDAFLFVEKLNASLQLEQAKRKSFYEQVDENSKMEFINGEIILNSPVMKRHNTATGNLYLLLKAFASKNNLGFVGIEKIMVSLTRNDYEPDLCFFGQATAKNFQADQMRFPAPDLVVEVVSKSTEKIDRSIKFDDYAAHKVSEYWIIDPDKETLEQYLLEEESYQLNFKSNDGIVHCRAVKGFDLPVKAIFNEKDNILALQNLL